MKYYIVGKNSTNGPTHDVSGDLNSYYELGWEIMVTHYRIKKFFYENKISNKDVIVTTNEERKFLYESIFQNVITWEDFLKIDTEDNEVVDLVNLSTMHDFHNEYINYEPEIDNQELNNILFSFKKDINNISNNGSKKYVCLQFRNRDWSTERNVDKNFFSDLIKYFNDEKKIHVYVMGFGSEVFCINENITYVDLQEFTSLINNENCLFFYSSMSGPAHLSYFFGHKNLYQVVNSVGGDRPPHLKDHPLYMGDKYNHTKVSVDIIGHHQNINFFRELLNNKLIN
jgi:hypothetical protein